jgi:hypothetical protein
MSVKKRNISTGSTSKLYCARPLAYWIVLFLFVVVFVPAGIVFPVMLWIIIFVGKQFNPELVLLIAFYLFYLGGVFFIGWHVRFSDATAYLVLSDKGIQYSANGFVIRSTWERIERLIDWPLPYLVVASKHPSSQHYSIRSNPEVYRRIPLYLFLHSRNNALTHDLHRYLPRLFPQK